MALRSLRPSALHVRIRSRGRAPDVALELSLDGDGWTGTLRYRLTHRQLAALFAGERVVAKPPKDEVQTVQTAWDAPVDAELAEAVAAPLALTREAPWRIRVAGAVSGKLARAEHVDLEGVAHLETIHVEAREGSTDAAGVLDGLWPGWRDQPTRVDTAHLGIDELHWIKVSGPGPVVPEETSGPTEMFRQEVNFGPDGYEYR